MIRMNAFETLDKRIQILLSEKGIKTPTECQSLAIPKILAGKNILVIAPTGIGKTEAAILPLLDNILNLRPEKISVLYITPLRALNRDLYSRLVYFATKLGINIAVRHGDTSKSERARQAKTPPDILITTPETLQILLLGKKMQEHLKNTRTVIVDEVHEFAVSERGTQLSVALERLRELAGREFQRIGLSATVGGSEEVARFIAGNEREIEILSSEIGKKLKISVIAQEIGETEKGVKTVAPLLRTVGELLNAHKSTLFFVNTRDTAEFIASQFHAWKPSLPIGIHHGSLSKEVRVEMEDDFKSGKLKSLICTSSLELGIDIGRADFSLQYNSPRQVSRLVQRIGRSGHKIGAISRGAIIATAPDELAESYIIAKKALSGQLEEIKIREGPLSVLANQITAFGMTGKCSCEQVYGIIKRAYPFRNLELKTFVSVLEQMKNQKLIFVENGTFRKYGKRTLNYFYENISMIPDEKAYAVIDAANRRIIGMLDESFVATYIQEGAVFVMKGTRWKVATVDKERIYVEQTSQSGEIPHWLGEQIPVPFEVALEVGKLRRNIIEGKKVDKNLDIFSDYIKAGGNSDNKVPNDTLITIEKGGNIIVVNACFGTKVNETLAQLLSSLLAAQTGTSIGVQTDPYRIILELSVSIDPNIIKEYLLSINSAGIEDILRASLKNSMYFKWQVFCIGKKFGLVSKDADYSRTRIHKLIETLRNTVICDEAVNRILWARMDLEKTKYIVNEIQTGRMRVQITKLTRIGLAGYAKRNFIITPERAEREILLKLKTRLENERVALVCLGCKRAHSMVIKNITSLKCPVCSSVLVAFAEKPEIIEKLRKNRISDREIRRLRKSANLILYNGKRALTALAARGVGIDTAARILAKGCFTEEDFLREILRAEIAYARTKRFW